MSKEPEARFDDAMLAVYQRARDECDYNATRFLRMLHEHRGLETARILLHASKVSEGYVALWERKRLEFLRLSVLFSPTNDVPCFPRTNARSRATGSLNTATPRTGDEGGS
jgi:hypothetical protein